MMQSVVIILMAMATVSTASAKSVVSTSASTCAMVNNDVRCWGYNGEGRLGLGHTSSFYQPQDYVIDFGDFVPSVLDCGLQHCCVIDSDIPGVKCWGYNNRGQLGYGDTNNRGDSANEMGTNLPLVELPSGFVPSKLALQFFSTCILSTEGEVVCFGYNANGELGLGHTNSIGDGSGEMGENMDFTDLGTDFGVVTDLKTQGDSICAVNSDGQVKCWGWNSHAGNLGLGDTNNRGDGSNEMGDYLPYTELGTGFIVQSMDCGGNHCCVLSTENVFKCFGWNEYGQLGYGDSNTRGDSANEMGDFLLAVSLGSDFVVQEFGCNWVSTCAISTEGQLKCFGYNGWGELGLGDTANRGDDSNEMGDYLPETDVGSGFTASGMRIGGGNPNYGRCVFEDSVSSELLLKCFGMNNHGQLGYGDPSDRGDNSNEMGENLPFVSFGEWPTAPTTVTSTSVAPTSAAPTTAAPTIAAPTTAAPTTAAPTTAAPTTAAPTSIPTEALCDSASMSAVNWHDLLNEEDEDTALLKAYSVDFDASTLSLTFSATMEYLGRSADGNFDDDYNLGTTYWIAFESFASIDDGLEGAGSCANRDGDDYGGDLEWAQFWNFTVNPADLAAASTEERTAYPASDWTLTAKNCSVVQYERTLSWTEMTACEDDAGNAVIDVAETDDAVTLSGTFYVELVSPYSMSSEGYYRTFPLIQQGFAIVLDRQVDVLASTGVQLFISTVMAYGRDDDGNYELTILVQSADYVMLGTDNAVTVISSPVEVSYVETVSDCLVASSFTCGQIFTATIPAECDDDNTVDLSGNYQFSFTPQCQTDDNGADEVACTVFVSTLDDTSGKVVLDVDASFTDNCDVNLFNVTFEADLTFYEDEAFTEAVGDNSDPFVIGQDTIYGKVLVDIAVDETDTMYTFVDVAIENIYVCTAEDTADLSLDSDSGIGGCLSSNIDADGPYVVYGAGSVTDYEGTTYDATGNEATFSFLTFDTPRTTINVHVQLLLTLADESGGRRRMLLETDVESGEGNAFRSFIGTASVQEGETTDDPVGTDGAAKVSAGFIAAMFAVTAYVLG